MNYYLGIDIGTSSVKILAVNENGKVRARFSEKLTTCRPATNRREQNPEEVLQALLRTLIKAHREFDKPPAGMGFSTAMHGLIAVDAHDNPLTDCWLWSDARSAEIAESLRKNAVGDEIYAASGTPLHAMSPLCKIRWLRENEPDIFAQTAIFCDLKSYLIRKLYGVWTADYSTASGTGLLNTKKLQYHLTALDFCGIEAKQLPDLVNSLHRLPALRKEYAEATGIAADTPCIVGAGDGVLANLGTAALTPGTAALTIGTSAAMRTVSSKFSTDENGILFTYLLEKGIFVLGGASNNGGNTAEWFNQKIEGKKSVGNMLRRCTDVPPGAEGLFFLPYLHGERAPLPDSKATGTFVGVKPHHSQKHFAKAVCEGLFFNLRIILEAIEITGGRKLDTVIAGGGFFRSSVAAQLAADTFGRKVILRENHDSSALGAVRMTLKALGVKDYAETESWFGKGEIFLPQVREYERIFGEFCAVFKKFNPKYHQS